MLSEPNWKKKHVKKAIDQDDNFWLPLKLVRNIPGLFLNEWIMREDMMFFVHN